MAHEINLVPDIKDEMIRTLKLRNFIFFLCLIVAAASVGVTIVVGLIMGGQEIAIDSKQKAIDNLSSKLNSYSDLNDFLTIKDQLSDISKLTDRKQVLSRTFNILSALIPTGADTITISELVVNLQEDTPTFSFDGQANAGKEPFIDYNVLDSFKKSMQYLRYDYGKYVDKDGNEIPSYCMIEQGDDGAILNDGERGIYAYWTIKSNGCKSENVKESDYSIEEYNGRQVVRIWRTPQFKEWYNENSNRKQPSMTLNGEISNVAHFNSSCITYSGDNSKNSSNPKWTTTNDCMLVPDGTEGIKITESSNGRGASDELVLRFSAVITFTPEVYKFTNTHMLAIAPSGRHNVTDSYVQIQAMFGERAADCAADDAACNSDSNSKSNTKDGGQK